MSSSKFSYYDQDQKIWRGPNRPSIYNTEVGLGYIILNKLKQNPDRVMQVCDDSGAEMTCHEMHSRTVKVFNFITSKTELKQGDVVGIIARNSENVAPVAFACFTLGLPLNALAIVLGVSEIVQMYSKTEPKVIFCDFDQVDKVVEAVKEIGLENCKILTFIKKVEGFEFVDEILKYFNGNVEEFEPPVLPNIASTPLVILCSSGTSSSIKGITRSHRHWIFNMETFWTRPFGENCSSFISSTLHWLTGLNSLISSALYQTKRIITTEDITIDLMLEIFERRKITSTILPPYMCEKIIKKENVGTFPHMKIIFIGGASIAGLSLERLKEIFPNATFSAGYGSSEIDIITIINSMNDKPGSSGKILRNCDVKIINENGANLGPNKKGQICVKTPIVFDGYYNDPETTKSAFDPDGWYYTGDVGYFDEDDYIFVIDRVKHMLKYNHIIITPLDIEPIINEIEGVISSCVVGVYDQGNDIIFAFVIKDQKNFELSEKFIENYVNEKVIDVKKIRGGVHFVKEFPVTTTGKVKNLELRELAAKIYKSKKSYLINYKEYGLNYSKE